MDSVVHHSAKPRKSAHKVPAHRQTSRPLHHDTKPSAHAARHKPKRPATLMRHSVTKPEHRQPHKPVAPANLHEQRRHERLERAKAVPKSQHIKRFPQHTQSHAAHRSVTKKHAEVKVEAPPAEAPTAHHQSHAKAIARAAPLSASEKLVTNALKNARSHEANKPFAKKPKKRLSHALGFKRHTANLAMGGLAALLLSGFFVYQNIPNLSMRVASTRAGFNAQLPGYQPSGFSQDKLVSYAPGKISVSFQSNSDDRQFQLTQQASNWNSQALADNYLAKAEKQYQTHQASGKTIYIYDDSSATWVNGGVWYQIEGDSNLSSDQILRIANSI